MATAAAHGVSYTYAEYLALEAASNVKHEFHQGHIYAMAGGTPEHAALQVAASGLLFGQLRGGACRAHSSDLRVRVLATGLATYPDVTVVCGRSERDPEDVNTVTNPTLILEVTSRSSEDYDRGDKFENYKLLPTLRQYVVVSHREHAVEVWSRSDAGAWTQHRFIDGEVAELSSISARIEVRELYAAAAEPGT